MKIYSNDNYEHMSICAADILCEAIRPNCVLGLATGSTPVGMYSELIRRYEAGKLDFRNVTTVNLDEYVGLRPSNEQSYRHFMNEHLFDRINIDKERTFVPDGSSDPELECKKYNDLLSSLTIDVQVLGIGHNGHIGFNEPSDEFSKLTHAVRLSPSTIKANSRFFASPSDVPISAITMGIGQIFAAKRILLLVSGKEKAEIVERALFGPITPKVPASVLQLHGDLVVVGDEAALSRI